MQDTIKDGKFVEIIYQVVDDKTQAVLANVEYPLGYVHGANDILSKEVSLELEGKHVGDIIKVPLDGNKLYGARDEALVFTDHLENVPAEYRKIGTKVVMENKSGGTKNFLVTRVDATSVTIDGNNPLSGRQVNFVLEVLSIRNATDEEVELGCAVGANPDINDILH